jgi:ADP-ribosyl-[dinitrogen reductase] hydrolase
MRIKADYEEDPVEFEEADRVACLAPKLVEEGDRVIDQMSTPRVGKHAADDADDRSAGALFGLAVGDALGAAVEFKAPGTFAPVTGFRGGGPHGLGPGEWTDDTSMALALADSLASVGWDIDDQARRYVAWWKKGEYSVNGRCFDIGNITRAALARFERSGDAKHSGDAAESASGNGSIMRLAPVPIRFAHLLLDDVVELGRLAAESSIPTHPSPQCVSACRYLGVVLAGLIRGVDRDEVLAPDWAPIEALRTDEALHPLVDAVASGNFRRKDRSEIRGSGWVVQSLEAALWAFHDAPTFRDAVLAAVNLGDDADTTGAICGQLAGAFFGANGIPTEWLDGLAKREWFENALRRLAEPHAVPPPSARTTPVAAGERRPFRLADAAAEPPTSRCYWVVPGRLLAGAYPGGADPAAHEAPIASLWNAGIRTFVTLMEEHETNNAGQPFAPYAAAVDALAAATGERASFPRFAIVDQSVPSREAMTSVLERIDRELGDGRPVYVHCFGGIGRTGTVVGCWLLRHGLASAADVIDVLARLRQKDEQRASWRSPETDTQTRFVKSWTRG